ncbi:MAG: hypothetical protein AAF628_24380 [Planctomycetota bacterium]
MRAGLWIAVALLVALVFVLWRSGDAAPITDAAAAPHATPPAPEPAPSAVPAPAAPPRRAPTEPHLNGIRVRVLDAQGRPAASVPVVLFAQHKEAPQSVEHGETDAQGRVLLIPRHQKPKAWGHEATGYTVEVDLPLEPRVALALGREVPSDADIELRLPAGAQKWIEPLRVRVLDARDAPAAGLTVRLEGVVGKDTKEFARADTAATGIALLPRRPPPKWGDHLALMGLRHTMRVSCDVPAGEPVRAAVAADAPTAELRLPPGGTVVAHVVDHLGRPVDGCLVRMWWRRVLDGPNARWERSTGSTQTTVQGDARFEYIGTGLELRLAATQQEPLAYATDVMMPGPTGDRDDVVATLRLDPPLPLLRGTLTDADGEPLADARFALAFRPWTPPRRSAQAGPAQVSWSYHSTDERGGFAIPYQPRDPVAGGRFAELQLRPPRSGPPPGWLDQFARVRLPNPLPTGGWSAGAVALQPFPVVVRGSTRREDSAPEPRARIRVEVPYGEPENTKWRNLNVRAVTSDADGRFEVRSTTRARRLRISAASYGKPKRTAASEIVTTGTRDVQLVMRAAAERPAPPATGMVGGNLVLPPGASYDRIVVHAMKGERRVQSERAFGTRWGLSLTSGAFTLRFLIEGARDPLLEIAGVVVRAGERCTDPRTTSVDLRPHVRLLRLRAGRPSGGVWRESHLALSCERMQQSFKTDDEGRAAELVPAAAAGFVLANGEHRSAPFDWRDGEQLVVLAER